MGSIRTAKLNCYERYLTEKYSLVYKAICFNLQCTSILGVLSLLYWYSYYFIKNKIRMKISSFCLCTSNYHFSILKFSYKYHVSTEIYRTKNLDMFLNHFSTPNFRSHPSYSYLTLNYEIFMLLLSYLLPLMNT